MSPVQVSWKRPSWERPGLGAETDDPLELLEVISLHLVTHHALHLHPLAHRAGIKSHAELIKENDWADLRAGPDARAHQR